MGVDRIKELVYYSVVNKFIGGIRNVYRTNKQYS